MHADSHHDQHEQALLDDYLRHIATEKRLAERSQLLYLHDLQRLAELAKADNIAPSQAQNFHLRAWVAQLHALGASPRTLALTLSVWRGWYRWLGINGHINANPCTGLRPPKRAQTLPKALAVDDAITLADYACKLAANASAADAAIAWRDAAMVELLYGSGLRVSELVNLDLQASSAGEAAGRGWVDSAAAEVHVQGKGGKRRTAPVGSKSLAALQRYAVLRADLQPKHAEIALFLGARGGRISPAVIWQMLQKLSLASGLPMRVHAHVLRHSFASHVLQSSGDLRAVQELLGHANIRTTQIYTRLDFQHLAQAYDAAHPRAKKP
jgi:integrase/recombinase XerC